MRRSGRKYQWFLLFCAGLACGAAAAGMLLDADAAGNSSMMMYVKSTQLMGTKDMGLFISVCLRRLLTAGALAGVIYMFCTPFCFYILTFLLGGAFGYVMAVLTLVYGFKSGLVMTALLMPQYLFYVPVYIIFLKLADARAAAKDKYALTGGGHKILAIIGSAVFILVLAGSLTESYVNPLIIKKFVKFF